MNSFSWCDFLNWGYPLAVLFAHFLGGFWYGPFFLDVWWTENNYGKRHAKIIQDWHLKSKVCQSNNFI